MWKFPLCPEPPEWKLEFKALAARYDFLARMANCPQEPEWHPEGDVLTHTGLVMRALIADEKWRALPERERHIVFAATLLHDVAKPDFTREEEGRIRSKGHTRGGAYLARRILMTHPDFAAIPFADREQIVGLVRWHGVPSMFVDRPDPLRALITVAAGCRVDLLAILCEADTRGRLDPNPVKPLSQIALFREFAQENNCLTSPYNFASDQTRVRYFADPAFDPTANLYHDVRCNVTLLSGLPAAGKDTWCKKNAGDTPIISLDALRIEHDVSPADDQSKIIDAAKEAAREHLRAREDFIWNATNTTRFLRDPLIAFFTGYNARVRIVYCEAPYAQMIQRNAKRPAPVPMDVIDRLLGKLDVPLASEAHEVEYCAGPVTAR
jgi:predicted kinase